MKVLITGAASGIGAATAEKLAHGGHDVAGIDIREGPRIQIADIRDQHQVDVAVKAAIEDLGGLDVLVNNAGIGALSDAGAPPDDWAVAIIETNLIGPWRVTGAAMPALIASRGRVVNIASAMSVITLPFSAAYTISKRGLAGYSDVLRLEYGDRIQVTTVYPGYVRTAIHKSSEAEGVFLSDVVPEDPLEHVAATIAGACTGRYRRDVPTSRLTATGIFGARHLRRASDLAVRTLTARFRRPP